RERRRGTAAGHRQTGSGRDPSGHLVERRCRSPGVGRRKEFPGALDDFGSVRLMAADGEVLHWPGRVLTAEDLRRSLNGHRRLVLAAWAVITPLAAEQIRADGICVSRRPAEEQPAASVHWSYAQDRPHVLVQSAIQALEREGVSFRELKIPG